MTPEINWLAILVAGLIPSIVGFIYYGPVFGKQWLSSLGKTEAEMEPSNPAVTYGLATLTSLLLAFSMNALIQFLHRDLNDAGELVFSSHNTFGHGAMHGAFMCIFVALPPLISMALYHKMPGKTILMNVVFWILCFAIMGGILDVWK